MVQLILASVRVSTVPDFFVMSTTFGFSLSLILFINNSEYENNTILIPTYIQQLNKICLWNMTTKSIMTIFRIKFMIKVKRTLTLESFERFH